MGGEGSQKRKLTELIGQEEIRTYLVLATRSYAHLNSDKYVQRLGTQRDTFGSVCLCFFTVGPPKLVAFLLASFPLKPKEKKRKGYPQQKVTLSFRHQGK